MSLFKRGNRPIKKRRQVGDDVETSEPGLFDDDPNDVIDEPVRQAGCGLQTSEAKEKPPLVLNRRSMFLWSAGLVFIMVWVFVLGVLVGRGTIFNTKPFQELEQRLSDNGNGPVPKVVEERQPAPEPEPVVDEKSAKLTFYDSLSKSKPTPPPPQVKVPPPPPPKPAVIETPKPVTPMKSPNTESPETGASASVERRETTPTEPVVTSGVKTVEPEKSKAPPPQRQSGENFTIQVAAAGTVEEADKIVARLRSKGLDAYHYEVELQGRQYFRIRVGRYKTKEEAVQVHDRLTAQGYKNMFISQLVD
jgi:DedD protein